MLAKREAREPGAWEREDVGKIKGSEIRERGMELLRADECTSSSGMWEGLEPVATGAGVLQRD